MVSKHGTPDRPIDWERYADCPRCGAIRGKACLLPNGSRQKMPHVDRPFTADALLELLAENEAERVAMRAELAELRAILRRHARALDLLLPQLTEDEAA